MNTDYEIDDLYCPKCGANTHSRSCSDINCQDGSIDESEEDYLMEGSNMVVCDTCKGTGIERWCPKCGEDLTGVHFDDDDDFDHQL